MKLSELLDLKEFKYRSLVTIGPNETILDAIKKLVDNDRGSLPVYNDKGDIEGIITERDIVRKSLTLGEKVTQQTKIKDVMSTNVIIGDPEDDLNYAINVMKEKRIRHLPIVHDRKLIGMISMRDLLGVQLEETKFDVRLLNDYISGGELR